MSETRPGSEPRRECRPADFRPGRHRVRGALLTVLGVALAAFWLCPAETGVAGRMKERSAWTAVSGVLTASRFCDREIELSWLHDPFSRRPDQSGAPSLPAGAPEPAPAAGRDFRIADGKRMAASPPPSFVRNRAFRVRAGPVTDGAGGEPAGNGGAFGFGMR